MKASKLKNVLLHVASWTISAGILAALLWLLDAKAVRERLAEANVLAALGVVGSITLLLTIKGLRWWIIASGHGSVRAPVCMRLAIVGMFLNAFIPLRGGDVTAGLLLSRESGIARSTALGTVALDKLFDMFGIVVLVVPLAFLGGLPDWIPTPPIATVILAIVFLATGLALRLRLRSSGERIAASGRIVRALAGFAEGFDSALRPGRMVACGAITVLLYGLLVLSVALGLESVGIRQDLGICLTFLLAVQFSAGIPLTPSSAGTMHGAITGVLAALGIEPEIGMSAAVVYHGAQTLPIFVLGVILTRGTAIRLATGETERR